MKSRSKGGGGQGFRDNSTKTFVIKHVKMGGGVSKIVLNCVTSFMDNPKGIYWSLSKNDVITSLFIL